MIATLAALVSSLKQKQAGTDFTGQTILVRNVASGYRF